MAFDLSTAKPVTPQGGFDLATAKPAPPQLSAADQLAADPTAGMSGLERFVAGYGKAGSDLVRGVGQRIGEGIDAIAPAQKNLSSLITGKAPETLSSRLGLPQQSDIDESKRLDSALMGTTGGKVGHIVGSIADAAPAAFVPGANSLVGAAAIGGGLGYVQPTATGESAGRNALMGAALGGGAAGAGKLVGMGANKLLQASAANTAANAGRQGAIQAARDAGYVLPPTDINPSPINSLAEGLSGKIKTQQSASFKNQPVTNALAAKALGLPQGTTITPDVLNGIRKTAGQAYEAVKGTGQVQTSEAYQQALDNIASKYQGAASSFPGLAKNEIPDMVAALKQPTFDAGHAVDAIGILRDSADQAFRAGNTGLAKASKDAAAAVESELGRHMQATGQDPALVDAFRNARKTIAQTYSVQKALNPANGDVSAKILAAQLKKGQPLSGELKTAAESGAAFPESMQALTRDPGGVSPLDYFGALINSKSSLAMAANGLAVRPLMRSALLSDVGQKLVTPSQTPNALLRLLSSDSTPGALIGQARRSTSATINRDRQP